MKKFLVTGLLIFGVVIARADEGMWLLPYLNKLNIKDMRAKGLKLKAEDIYNVNGSSLKDAIVIFGGGCTGEVVSAEGLLLTNHHCGYGNIQALSSVENDYLKNGFWAMSRGEEIPAPGLSVTFIRRMDDVTAAVLGAAANMEIGALRDSIVKVNTVRVTEEWKSKNPGMDVAVRDFLGGNQFFAITSEKFTDVRLVGTPPNSMGKFGGDTDNWMWPRHTDDFSMFRIYAGKDNRPASYSPDNVPYKAPVHLKISLGGVEEGDYAMVIGFPGSTDRYMTTGEMKHLIEVENANRIYIRGERQAILMADMKADDEVRLKYAAKYAQSSNYWKNSIGMNKALIDNKIPERKAALESRFQRWADGRGGEYARALGKIRESVESTSRLEGLIQTYSEALWNGIEIMPIAMRVSAIKEPEKLLPAVESFYKNYNEPTDRRAAKRMIAVVRERVPVGDLPPFYATIDSLWGGNIDAFVDDLYDKSVFTSREKLLSADFSAIADDPASRLSAEIRATIIGLVMPLRDELGQRAEWQRVYIRGLAEMDPTAKFYPDANFTQRLTYGTVLPYDPRDGVTYHYYTTLKGVIEKEDTSNPLEFSVPERVKELYAARDYGVYGQNGELRVNFLSNNDITGGNSGSPVLDARGNLIGLAFDGNWEAMSGDIVFEPTLQRCINLDIRYVLWTIDKYARASHFINEMTIVK